MWNTLIDNDPTSQILAAYIAKKELRQLLAAARERADDTEIRTRLYRFYSWCADTAIPKSPDWPARSKPGGRRSWRFCTPD